MKKLMCKQCAVIAAIFAVCLFVTSCGNSVQPSPKPNPKPAPGPAPSPAPQPTPAPSVEVSTPSQTPSAGSGATEQEPALPPVETPVETENVTVTLQSITIVGGGYGILANFGTRPVTVQVPKKLGGADRAEKVKERLLFKLGAEGYSGCVLCATDNGTAPEIASSALLSTNPVYVKQQRTAIKVQITIQSVTGDKTVTSPPADAGTYRPCTNEAFLNTIVSVEVWNTDTDAAKQTALHDAVNNKIGAGYGCFTNSATESPATLATAAAFGIDGNSVIYVGKKE